MPGYGLVDHTEIASRSGRPWNRCQVSHMLGYDEQSPRNSAMALMDPIGAARRGAGLLRCAGASSLGAAVVWKCLCTKEASVSRTLVIRAATWRQPRCQGSGHPLMAPHGVFRCCGDDQWLALALPMMRNGRH